MSRAPGLPTQLPPSATHQHSGRTCARGPEHACVSRLWFHGRGTGLNPRKRMPTVVRKSPPPSEHSAEQSP
eukprot:14960789-Alexandrium_andersonii.AAC.1